VVPAQWLGRCTAEILAIDEVRRYGYQWYIGYWASCIGTRAASSRSGARW